MRDQRHRSIAAVILMALFAFCVVWPRIPDSMSSRQATGSSLILIESSGITTRLEPLSESVMASLENPEVVNGVFSVPLADGSENEVRVFLASWGADDSRFMAAIGHTPDICWKSAGWQQVEFKHAPESNIIIPGLGNAPFVWRQFRWQETERYELVCWALFIDGHPATELLPSFEDLFHQSALAPFRFRTARVSHAIEAVFSRKKFTGRRQFVRLSITLSGPAVNGDLITLRALASSILSVQ